MTRLTNLGRVTRYEVQQMKATHQPWKAAWSSLAEPWHPHSLEEWVSHRPTDDEAPQ